MRRALSILLFVAALFGLDYFAAITLADPAPQHATITSNALGVQVVSGFVSQGFVGNAYSASFAATGAVGTVTWSHTGTLPPGLSQSPSTGAITGTPTTAGTYASIIVKWTTPTQPNGAQSSPFGIVISALSTLVGITISPTSATVAIGMQTSAFTASCTYTGTAGPCNVVWASQNQAFCTIAQTGVVTGVAGGNCGISASIGPITSNSANVSVTGSTPPSTPQIVTTTLPPAFLSTAYQANTCLVVNGGTVPFTFGYTGTNRPPTGITLTLSGAGVGCFTGTPSASGTFAFVVHVTDSTPSTSADVQLSIGVATVQTPINLALQGGGTSVSLATTGTAQATAACSWSNGNSTQPCPPTLAYASDNPSAATVNSSTGLISAAGAGVAHITATAGSATSNQITVTVGSSSININSPTTAIGPCEINIACPPVTLLGSGGSGTGFVWASVSGAPPGMAVSSSGTVSGTPTTTAGSPYSWVIRLTDSLSNTVTQTFPVTIASVTAIGQLIANNSTAPPSIGQGGATLQFTAPVMYSDGATHNLTQQGGGAVPHTLVQISSGSDHSGTSLSSCVVGDTSDCMGTTPPTVTTGNLGYAVCKGNGGGFTINGTNTDPLGNTWTPIGSFTGGLGQQFYSVLTHSGADALSCVPTSAHGNLVAEYREYIINSPALDVHSEVVNSGSTLPQCTPTPITTLAAYDVIITSCVTGSSAQTFTTPSGFGNAFTDFNGIIGTSDQFVSTTGTFSPGYASTPSLSNPVALMASFSGSAPGGLVWNSSVTATATINSSGLATSNQTGTTNIQACIGSVCSPIDVLTVTAPADTAVVVSPASTGGTVGQNIQFAAVGNNNKSNNYTSVATWGTSNSSVLQSLGQGLYKCLVAGGPITVTATSGSLQAGTATVTSCANPVTGTLLGGCTVNSSNVPSCSIPAGWTLVAAQGFDGGAIPGSQFTFGNIVTGVCHTGNSCLGSFVNADQASPIWGLQQGQLGTFTSIYASWFEWQDSAATYNDEEFVSRLFLQDAGGNFLQEIVFDRFGQSFNASSAPTVFSLQGLANSNAIYGKAVDTGGGSWHQWESLFTPGTNGTLEMWRDGSLVASYTGNTNADGRAFTASGSAFSVSGPYTKLLWTNNGNAPPSGTCTALGNGSGIEYNGGGQSFATLGNLCPPTAPSFNRYVDDAIVIKQ